MLLTQGDVVENAWPQQLNRRTQLPTLNLGLDGAGNDTIKLIYDRACKIFNVENVFVMYSFFLRRLEDNISHNVMLRILISIPTLHILRKILFLTHTIHSIQNGVGTTKKQIL